MERSKCCGYYDRYPTRLPSVCLLLCEPSYRLIDLNRVFVAFRSIAEHSGAAWFFLDCASVFRRDRGKAEQCVQVLCCPFAFGRWLSRFVYHRFVVLLAFPLQLCVTTYLLLVHNFRHRRDPPSKQLAARPFGRHTPQVEELSACRSSWSTGCPWTVFAYSRSDGHIVFCCLL